MEEQQILQIIGQLESSIHKLDNIEMSEEDYQDYCDSAYTCVTYWRIQLRNIRKNKE